VPANKIILFIVTALGILSAVIVGAAVGNQDMLALVAFGLGVFAIGLAVTLREKIWIVIPLFWSMSGKLTMVPLPFSVSDLSIIYATAVGIILYAMQRPKISSISFLLYAAIFLNIALIIAIYLNNPVGIRSMSSELVGGRKYFNIALGFCAFLVISLHAKDAKWLARIPLLFLAGAFISTGFAAVTYYIPATAPILFRIYSGVTVQDSGTLGMDYFDRPTFFADLANPLWLALCCYFRPTTLLSPTNPIRFVLAIAAGIMLLLSGFRTAIVGAIANFSISSFFQKRTRDAIIVGVIGMVAVGMISATHGTFYTLPLSAQRALTFLPGEWDSQVQKDADFSSQWRFEMWDYALNSSYIQNWWIGDGFGFKLSELTVMESKNTALSTQDIMLISGALHSGPLSTLRHAGITGIFFLYVLFFVLAFYAFQLMRKTSPTNPLSPAILFIGIPLLLQPVWYTLVFGSYDSILPSCFLNAGLLTALYVAAKNKSKLPSPKPELVAEKKNLNAI